jgi:hypothetical protein
MPGKMKSAKVDAVIAIKGYVTPAATTTEDITITGKNVIMVLSDKRNAMELLCTREGRQFLDRDVTIPGIGSGLNFVAAFNYVDKNFAYDEGVFLKLIQKGLESPDERLINALHLFVLLHPWIAKSHEKQIEQIEKKEGTFVFPTMEQLRKMKVT